MTDQALAEAVRAYGAVLGVKLAATICAARSPTWLTVRR